MWHNPTHGPTSLPLRAFTADFPIIVGEKDGLTAITTENHVVEPPGNMDAWITCHVDIDTARLQLVSLEDPMILTEKRTVSTRSNA